MQNSNSFNVLSSLCNNNSQSTNNLIEFSNIFENIRQHEQQNNQRFMPLFVQPSNTNTNSRQVLLSTGSSTASSISSFFGTPLSSDSIISVPSNSSKQYDYRKLFVGNLPSNTKLSEIIDFFKKYGSINEKLSVVKDQNYAFVHFYNEDDAKIALKDANDSLFKNRYIRVQFSTSQAHIKKSKTFDASIGIFKETAVSPPSNMTESQKIIQPKVIGRPITGGNKCAQLTRSTTNYNFIQPQPYQLHQSYYSPFQHYQLFQMDPQTPASTPMAPQMTKSATFQY